METGPKSNCFPEMTDTRTFYYLKIHLKEKDCVNRNVFNAQEDTYRIKHALSLLSVYIECQW